MNIPREDVLVSVCLADPLQLAVDRDRLIALAGTLEKAFRYWEILIVTNSEGTDDFGTLLATIKNLRILRTRNGVPFYRRRVISATEAIGDIVLLTSLEEVVAIDMTNLILDAAERNCVIVGRRDQRHLLVDPVLSVLGRAGGVRAGTGETLTVVYPRTVLNRLLARPDRALALRFPPRENAVPLEYRSVQLDSSKMRSSSGLWQRLDLIQQLLVNSAPKVLGIVSLLAVLTTLTAVLFMIYAVAVWFLLDSIQPGWLTTSLVLSGTAAFLGVAIFGLSTGLIKLIDLMAPDLLDDVIDEQGRADLFALVTQDLNIEKATPVATREKIG